MARSERLALLAIGSAAIAACNVIAGIDQFHDVPCEPCEAGPAEASLFPPDGPLDGTTQDTGPVAASAEAGDAADATDATDAADADDATLDAAGDADADAGPGVLPEASVDYRWPRWLMPNGAEAGLPHPATYAPVAGTDGGVYDAVTHLIWGSVQPKITTIADARLACPGPWRLPSRIELVSILDTSQSSPLVNPAFSTVKAGGGVYWTSSTNPDGVSYTVDFNTGIIKPVMNGSAVICVQPGDGGAP